MPKTKSDLGDLSFTVQELRDIEKTEHVEEAHKAATTRVPESEKDPKRQYKLWDLIQKITAQ